MSAQSQQAYNAGYEAAKTGNATAPAMCKVYMSLIDGLKVGEGGMELAKAWNKGFHARIDEELALLID